MEYLITFIALLLVEWAYMPVARHFEIGNKVTFRSSHKQFTITGGGVVFLLAVVAFYCFNSAYIATDHHYAIYTRLLVGAIVLGIVSYIDDVHDVAPLLRLTVQVIVVMYTFYWYIDPVTIHYFVIIMVCGVGFINAYNFMDGINGMLAGYTMVLLGTFYFAFSLLNTPNAHLPMRLIIMMALATVVFAIFNMRSRALCFAGDVGSIVTGYIVTYLLVQLILSGRDATPVVFVAVYAVDAGLTVVQRLFIGENIFIPHRRHVYQVLVNQWAVPHWQVATWYATTQAVINIVYFFIPPFLRWSYFIVVVVGLTAVYFTIKRDNRSRRK